MNQLPPPKPLSKLTKIILLTVTVAILGMAYLGYMGKEASTVQIPAEEKILYKFEQTGVWKADAANHRCLVDPIVWYAISLEKKEDILRTIYREEGTWWNLNDMYSGKLLGEVSSWGAKVHP